MEEGMQKSWPIAIIALTILLLSNLNPVHAEDSSNEFIIDDRLQMISLASDETYQQTIQLEENQLVSVNVGCSACQVQLDAGDSSQSLSLIHI